MQGRISARMQPRKSPLRDVFSTICRSIIRDCQAKLDNIKVFRLIETLKGLQDLQLSVVVAEVLNYNRKRTSTLGFKREIVADKAERRNILI